MKKQKQQIVLTEKHIKRVSLEEQLKTKNLSIYDLPTLDGLILNLIQNMNGCIIAGGSALAMYEGKLNEIKDWDVYFTNTEIFNKLIVELEGMKFIRDASSAYTYTYKKDNTAVQLIKKRFYQSVEEIFSYFDFTVCCFAVEGNELCFLKTAVKDVATRQYNLIFPANPSMLFTRIARYGAKGFIPSYQCSEDLIDYINGKYTPKIENKDWVGGKQQLRVGNLYDTEGNVINEIPVPLTPIRFPIWTPATEYIRTYTTTGTGTAATEILINDTGHTAAELIINNGVAITEEQMLDAIFDEKLDDF